MMLVEAGVAVLYLLLLKMLFVINRLVWRLARLIQASNQCFEERWGQANSASKDMFHARIPRPRKFALISSNTSGAPVFTVVAVEEDDDV